MYGRVGWLNHPDKGCTDPIPKGQKVTHKDLKMILKRIGVVVCTLLRSRVRY